MPLTTPVYSLPYQTLADAPDGPNLGEDLALAVEAGLVSLKPYAAHISSAAGSGDISAETAVLTLTGFTFETGRAYRFSTVGGFFTSADGVLADFRLKKTSTAGTTYTEFYRLRGAPASAVMAASMFCYLRRSAGTDLTTDVVLTLQTTSGTAQHWGTASIPRALVAEDVGSSAEYSFALAVT